MKSCRRKNFTLDVRVLVQRAWKVIKRYFWIRKRKPYFFAAKKRKNICMSYEFVLRKLKGTGTEWKKRCYRKHSVCISSSCTQSFSILWIWALLIFFQVFLFCVWVSLNFPNKRCDWRSKPTLNKLLATHQKSKSALFWRLFGLVIILDLIGISLTNIFS